MKRSRNFRSGRKTQANECAQRFSGTARRRWQPPIPREAADGRGSPWQSASPVSSVGAIHESPADLRPDPTDGRAMLGPTVVAIRIPRPRRGRRPRRPAPSLHSSRFIFHFSLFPPLRRAKTPRADARSVFSPIPFFPLISAAPRSCAGSPRPWASRPDRPPPAPAGWAGCGWNPGS